MIPDIGALVSQANQLPDPQQRLRQLRQLRADLSHYCGLCDRYMADVDLLREADAVRRVTGMLHARETADVRDRLVNQGLVAPEAADRAGLFSHDDLDGQGTLEEAILMETWSEAARKRSIEVRQEKARMRAFQRGPSFRKRARELDRDVSNEIARGPAGMGSPGVAERDTGPVPDLNAPSNPAGKTSQKRLLAYAKRALTQPSTSDVYAHVAPDGTRQYDKSRQKLHQKIVAAMLDGHASQKEPTAIFTGGGYGAGKGGVLHVLKRDGKIPKDAVVLDPDKIKAMIPEFKRMLRDGDPEANMAVYEEAWDIAKQVQKEAQRRHLNVVVDGIGNTSPQDMLARVQSFKDAGYAHTEAHYVTTDVDKAVETTMHRATRPSAPPEDRRFIPEEIVRATHRDVAAALPGIIAGSREPGAGLDELHVYDTSAPALATDPKTGKRIYQDPRELFGLKDGKESVLDQPGWEKALGRAGERVAGDDAPARADTELALREVQAKGLDKFPEPSEAATKLLGGARDTQHQFAGDPKLPLHVAAGIVYRGGKPSGLSSPGTSLVTDPGVQYDMARKAEHDKLIGKRLAKPVASLLGEDHPIVKKLLAGSTALDLSPDEVKEVNDAAFKARNGANPDFLFLAGGGASGKSSALKMHPELQPEHALTIDPDDVMENLPEYKRLVGMGEPYAATAGHEEASDVSKRLQREGELLGLNLVADGVGNSRPAVRDESGKVVKPGKFASKMIAADKKGYNVHAMTVTVPTDTAVVRSVRRALGDGVKPGTGRMVPIPVLREQHASVSRNFDEVKDLPFLKSLRVIDTRDGVPVTIIHGGHGRVVQDDPELASEFAAKAKEHDG